MLLINLKKDKVNPRNNFIIEVKHLPKGAKPPATVDEGGLRLFLESYDSVSGVVDLLPVCIACDKFY